MASIVIHEPRILDPKKAKKVFNPRFLDMDLVRPVPNYPDSNYAHRQLDEAEYSIKIYNFSNRVCHIGYRDGSITTLRGSSPLELEKRACYTANIPRDTNGKILYPRNDRVYSLCPKVSPGIYVCVKKQVSTSSSLANQGISSILWHQDEEGCYIVGKGVSSLLNETGGLEEQDRYEYMIRKGLKEKGYAGPTYYSGYPVSLNSTSLVESCEKRHYEALYLEYFIPIEDINKSDDRYLYVECLDIVLSTGLDYKDIIHPYSDVGKATQAEESFLNKADKEAAAGVFIINVDNSAKSSVGTTYYVNLGGTVTMVKPTSDTLMQEGLYIHQVNKAAEGESKAKSSVVYLTHDQAFTHKYEDIPKFYRTYVEAQTMGDVDEAIRQKAKEAEHLRQAELAEMKANLEKLKIESAETKEALELARIKLKDELDKEAELRKEIADRRRDYYEERSYSRKDNSEFMKYILAFGAGLVGLVIGLIKR